MPLGYTQVRVNIGALVVDGIDADDTPDDMPMTGTLTLTPMIADKKLLVLDDAGVAKLRAVRPIIVDIGPLGDIAHRNRDYVKVPAPDSSNTNLSQLQWRASFSVKQGTQAVGIDDIYFWAVSGESVNLADNVNTAPSSTAVQLTRGPRGFKVGSLEQDGTQVTMYLDDPDVSEIGTFDLPEGGAPSTETVAPLVSNEGATRTAVDQRVQTVGDTRYAPVSRAAKNPDEIAVGTITRSANGAATGFAVVWDDGATGVFTGTESTSTPGAIDSYTVTHVIGQPPVTTTYTQPALTRDATGAVVARPAMTVS